MNNSPTKFLHLRNSTPGNELSRKGGATIAYRVDAVTGNIEVAGAICSDKDFYNKKLGRQKAETRLFNQAIGYGVLNVIESNREDLVKSADAMAERMLFTVGNPNSDKVKALKEELKTSIINTHLAVLADPALITREFLQNRVEDFFLEEIAPKLTPYTNLN